MYDILHDTKCVTCYKMQNAGCATWHKMYDMLHGEKYVTCYMTHNVWHVTWWKMCDMFHAKECDVLHATKTINYTPTNQTLNEYIHPDITGCLSSYSWIFIHLSQLIQ